MDTRAVAAVAALDDPVRAALYRHARGADGPVTREGAAAAVGISRKLAAFHLDKLVACGLLRSPSAAAPATVPATAPATAPARRGVGRAPKLYEPTDGVSVQVPERDHALLAGSLVDAVLDQREDESARAAALRVARERGRDLGAAERDRSRPGRLGAERALGLTREVLDRHGFEPSRRGECVQLRNCPFHPLAARAPALVCGLNREFVAGLLDGLQASGVAEAALAPAAGRCCVEIRPRGRDPRLP